MEPCSRDQTGVHVRRRLERFGLHRLQGHLLVRRSQRVPLDPRAKPGPRHALPGKKRDRLQQLNKRERESFQPFILFHSKRGVKFWEEASIRRRDDRSSKVQTNFSVPKYESGRVFLMRRTKKKKILCVELLELLFPL